MGIFMAHIFISYSKQNIEFVRCLHDLLVKEGFAVWRDEAEIIDGDEWWSTIEQNIETCSAFLIIMSREAKSSVWVEREILKAEALKKPIFPILLSGELWSRLANIQYTDMHENPLTELPIKLIRHLQNVAFLPSEFA